MIIMVMEEKNSYDKLTYIDDLPEDYALDMLGI